MPKYTYTLEKVLFDDFDHPRPQEKISIQADGVVWEESRVEFYVADEIGDKTTVASFSVRHNVEFNITSVENNNA